MREVPDYRNVCEKQLLSATAKLNTNGLFPAYNQIFTDWEKEGIISECQEVAGLKSSGRNYLPHRAVIKPESKTTPVRPVFDASCKVGRSPSLNDCLEKGPNLLELIPSILLRFRTGKIGVLSDIRKAFLMVEIREEDREFVRFLWWEDFEKKILKTFRHNRVVFGMNCSPFLLAAVIEYHLNAVQDSRKPIASMLLKSLYVDNCVTSVNSQEEYELFKFTSTKLMADAKMELRQWECTDDGSSENVTSVLGLKWEKAEDQLYCEALDRETPLKITKRVILSQVQKIFDPLGFLCPAVLRPKLMLQEMWKEKGGWDDEVTKEMSSEFYQWWIEVSQVLSKAKIPRNCTGGEELQDNFQIHTFCDASKYAYAAAVFLRVENADGVSVQLLLAKSRVAPLKPATIPRLELLSCVIASRLMSTVKEALSMANAPCFFWSDSTTALSWIKRNDDWGTFVGNRVREICTLTNPENWRHVPGIKNPADLPSRGCSPLKLLESRWWEGPEWLKHSEQHWPSGENDVDEDLVLQEKKKTVVSMAAHVQSECLLSLSVGVMAMGLRFIDKMKKKSSEYEIKPSPDEIARAELKIFRLIQDEAFEKDKAVISGLRVERDETGLIRVKTKLVNRQDSDGFRYPVLLPSSHPMVDLLIREEHQFNCHAGAQFLMGKLREKCWIVHGRRAIKKILKTCVTCRRFSTKSPNVPPAALPEDRVKNVKAFDLTGVDLAGPLILKDKSKCYIVLFTCAVYRCVHLELVQCLSTEDFLLAFMRFCKRKRRANTVYSDNGTNFVGADNLFKLVDWKEVERRTQQQRIKWIFNPPSAPWWGGWWERLVRSVKDLLKRMLGFGKLTYVQLETCLCEVESAINRRPLTYVTEEQDDLIPLTPAMFIHDLPDAELPEAEVMTVSGLQTKFKIMKKLSEELASRFRREYLAQLVQRGKEKNIEEFKTGDVVLVGADNKKRIEWSMGRILELFPGKDGKIRVARVKTKAGELLRPLQRLYPLEVSSHTELPAPSTDQSAPPISEAKKTAGESNPGVFVKTRGGRVVKPPVKFGH